MQKHLCIFTNTCHVSSKIYNYFVGLLRKSVVFYLSFWALLYFRTMVLVGGVILPHGTMSFDGQGSESSVESCHARYQGLPKDLQV